MNPQTELEKIAGLAREIPIPRSVANGHIDPAWEQANQKRWSLRRPTPAWATFALTASAACALVSVGLVAHHITTTPSSPPAAAGVPIGTPRPSVIVQTSESPPATTPTAPPGTSNQPSSNPAPVLTSGAPQTTPALAPAPAPPVTFGFDPNNPAGFNDDQFIANRKRVNGYTIATRGSISKLSIWLHPTATAGSQTLEGIVYTDASNDPGQLIAVTEQFTFKSSNTQGWYDLSFSTPVTLNPGKYWIGVITSGTDHVTGFHYNTVSGARYYNANQFAAGPSQTFSSSGAVTIDNEETLLYAH